nr:class I SAM-dependent methyltransferase [Glycomyces buryatensis]
MQPGEFWSKGDYAAAGDRWAEASVRLAETYTRPGNEVLDLACGPGAFAIEAAEAGAKVTALDAAGALLDLARVRAENAGAAVEWIQADMTAVPADDAGFDVVASAFGCMFAPDPVAMATELVRLCRKGGRIAVLAWTPESAFGAMAPLAGRFLPNGGVSPVERWSRPENVAELFADLPVRLSFTVRTVDVVWDDLDAAVDEIVNGNPAWIMIRSAVEPTGRWEELRAGLRELFAVNGKTEEHRFVLPVDYLETLARKRLGPVDQLHGSAHSASARRGQQRDRGRVRRVAFACHRLEPALRQERSDPRQERRTQPPPAEAARHRDQAQARPRRI